MYYKTSILFIFIIIVVIFLQLCFRLPPSETAVWYRMASGCPRGDRLVYHHTPIWGGKPVKPLTRKSKQRETHAKFVRCSPPTQIHQTELKLKSLNKRAAFILPIITKNEKKYIILGKERWGPRAGKYSLIGGGVETNESYKEGLKREIYEESRLLPEKATDEMLCKLLGKSFDSFNHNEILIPFHNQPGVKVYVFDSDITNVNKQNKLLQKIPLTYLNNGAHPPEYEMENLTLVLLQAIKNMRHNQDIILDINGNSIQISFIAFRTTKMYIWKH